MGYHKESEINLSCCCGCSKLEISQWFDGNKPEEVSFAQYISTNNIHYLSVWRNIVEKFKLIWCVLSGKKYCVFALVLQNKEEIKAFKDAVAKLDENVDFDY